jgi:hypothetical protein
MHLFDDFCLFPAGFSGLSSDILPFSLAQRLGAHGTELKAAA